VLPPVCNGNFGHYVSMPFTWVKPLDLGVLEGRPLLDLGTGDGQTLRALVEPKGLVVGIDSALGALKASGLEWRVGAEADGLPFAPGSIGAVLAADLLHHLPDEALAGVLREVRRALRPGGRLVDWSYEAPGRGGPGDPQHTRSFDEVSDVATRCGLEVREIELVATLEPSPATVGMVATRLV
jgi:SAM-dependent methyltransferase